MNRNMLRVTVTDNRNRGVQEPVGFLPRCYGCGFPSKNLLSQAIVDGQPWVGRVIPEAEFQEALR